MASKLRRVFIEQVEMSAKAAFGPIVEQSCLIETPCAVGHRQRAEQPDRLVERLFRRHDFLLLALTTAGTTEAGRVSIPVGGGAA